jgi:hypothetical protein
LGYCGGERKTLAWPAQRRTGQFVVMTLRG